MRRLLPVLGCTIALVCGLTACERPAPPSTSPPMPAAAPASPPAATSGLLEAQQAYERMDGRTQVPLVPMMANHQKQNMRDHLVAVQEIVLAASTDDFGAVERAAGRMGFTEQMGQMCTHMGAGAPGFTEQALKFHHTADTIADAARQHDRGAVMRALGTTLQTCTACHATFRQSVVDDATWTRLTSSVPPAGRRESPAH